MDKEIAEIIEDACPEALIGMSEGFRLEFKEKDRASKGLTKVDKRNIGAAVSGFSNADGGTLVIGCRTSKVDGIDTVVEVREIEDARSIHQKIEALLGEVIRPDNPHVASFCLTDFGPIIVDVPASDSRPHMSMAPDHQKYFRRTYDGTRVADHTLVRDMMLAQRQADLLLDFELSGIFGYYQADGRYCADVHATLFVRNEGMVSAKAPYVIYKSKPRLRFEPVHPLTLRRRRDGQVGYYSRETEAIHPEDEYHLGVFRLSVIFEPGPGHQNWIRKSINDVDASSWVLAQTFGGSNRSNEMRSDHLKLDIRFGAINAPIKKRVFRYEKSQIVEWLRKKSDLVEVWKL